MEKLLIHFYFVIIIDYYYYSISNYDIYNLPKGQLITIHLLIKKTVNFQRAK